MLPTFTVTTEYVVVPVGETGLFRVEKHVTKKTSKGQQIVSFKKTTVKNKNRIPKDEADQFVFEMEYRPNK